MTTCLQIYHEALVPFIDLPRHQSRLYRMNANRSSINTYIYIFPHNLCKIQVFKLVFDS